MRAVAIIPARLGSTRLPRKPLLDITGRPLVVHVVEAVRRSRRVSEVVVATDSQLVRETVESWGGRAILTRGDHLTGSDRIGEVLPDVPADIIVNVQGDEPEIDPEVIDGLIALLEARPDLDVTTAAAPINDEDRYLDPNVVKVVVTTRGDALYFSRSAIPGHKSNEASPLSRGGRALQHVGIYAYRRAALERFLTLPPSHLELMESLEQLRLLEAGARYGVIAIPQAHRGIDTPDDYAAFVARYGVT